VVVRHLELALQAGSLRARLDEERRLLDTVLAQTNDGLFILDGEGRVVRCNAAAERMTGWREADLLGTSFAEALQARPMRWGGDLEGADDLPLTLEETGRDQQLELVLVNRAGQPFYTEACVTPVTGPASTPARLVVSMRDVSAGREAEELQATFLAVISHELQTPLAIIRGYAELLADSVDRMPPARMKPKLDAIADESDRLSKMVASLLDASRIGAGGLELTREPVDMLSLVRRAVQRVEAISPDHQFVIALPDDLPAVLADYARIEQVVHNLLENAVKYSPKGTRITVTGEALSDAVVLRVRDEGVGVPAAERERIFHRFARLDSRVVRQMKGVGLGLYIARAIIQAHGGRIWVDAAPGGGAQFSFSLPRQYNAPLPVLFGRN
jgi:PAS domain S-box-containing protein